MPRYGQHDIDLERLKTRTHRCESRPFSRNATFPSFPILISFNLWSGMGNVVPARTSSSLHPPLLPKYLCTCTYTDYGSAKQHAYVMRCVSLWFFTIFFPRCIYVSCSHCTFPNSNALPINTYQFTNRTYQQYVYPLPHESSNINCNMGFYVFKAIWKWQQSWFYHWTSICALTNVLSLQMCFCNWTHM